MSDDGGFIHMETAGLSSGEDRDELLQRLQETPDVHWHTAVVDSNGLTLMGTNRVTQKRVSLHAQCLPCGFKGEGPDDTLVVLKAYGFNEEHIQAVLDPRRKHCMFTRPPIPRA